MTSAPAHDLLLSDLKDGVLTLTINDPKTKNSMDFDFWVMFAGRMAEIAADDAVGAIILTGAGGFFSSGGNMSTLAGAAALAVEDRKKGADKLHDAIKSIRDCPKPVIAAVEGGAAGAGLAFALACDLVIAAEDAYASVAYIKIGLTPDGGTTAFLSESLPRQLVNEMAMFGEKMPMKRLHEAGCVNRLVPSGATLAAAGEVAKYVMMGPPKALAGVKSLTHAANKNSLDEQLEAEATLIAEALGGAEAKEGVTAFMQKRMPAYRS